MSQVHGYANAGGMSTLPSFYSKPIDTVGLGCWRSLVIVKNVEQSNSTDAITTKIRKQRDREAVYSYLAVDGLLIYSIVIAPNISGN